MLPLWPAIYPSSCLDTASPSGTLNTVALSFSLHATCLLFSWAIVLPIGVADLILLLVPFLLFAILLFALSYIHLGLDYLFVGLGYFLYSWLVAILQHSVFGIPFCRTVSQVVPIVAWHMWWLRIVLCEFFAHFWVYFNFCSIHFFYGIDIIYCYVCESSSDSFSIEILLSLGSHVLP